VPDLNLVEITNLATFMFLALWALLAVRAIARGERHAILFVIVVHFVFCGLPLLTDVVIGQPSYRSYPGFYEASRDPATSYIYCAFVAFCSPFWWWAGRRRESRRDNSTKSEQRRPPSRWLRIGLRAIAVSPVVVLALVPDPLGTLRYFSGIRDAVGAEGEGPVSMIYELLRASTTLSVLACAGLFLLYRRVNLVTLLLTPAMVGLSIWLHGKRSIIAIVIALLGYVLWDKGYLRGTRLLAMGTAGAIVFALFSYWHLSSFRGFDLTDRGTTAYYERARFDFGRDDVIKLAIFNELGGESTRTLEHRGQSFLFYATVYVPRLFWPDKPWPYAVYVTASALALPREPIGWGFTTSVLEEPIANLGWIGLLVGPLLLTGVCRLGDSCAESWILLLTIMVAILFLSVQLVAFGPLMLCWVVAVVWAKQRQSKDRARRPRLRLEGTHE